MPSPRLLRRALALAAVSLVPLPLATGPASAAAPEVRRTEIPVGDGGLASGRTLSVALSGGPELVGLTWSGGGAAAFEVRARNADGWSGWAHLEAGGDEGPDAGGEGGTRGTAGPAYLGRELVQVEVRAEGAAPTGLVLHAIDSDPVAADDIVTAAGVAQPPTIITRAQWGANEGWRDDSGGECDGTPDYVDDIQMAFVHHTAGEAPVTAGDSAAIIRGIYDFHVHSNGWCDVGYNFFVDPFGQVFEGRFGGIRRTAIGGHASGFNSLSTGVAVLGDYSTAAVPDVAYEALVDVLAFKLGFHGVNPLGKSTVRVGSNTSARWPEGTVVTLDNINGHRDGNNTACPGQQLYNKLPQLRQDVADAITEGTLEPAYTVPRLAGADRYATAATLAKAAFPSAGTVYLARGDDFADALAANHLAGVGSSPVLLSTRTQVPQPTLDALTALGATKVRLLGGTAALGVEVETTLRGRGLDIERLAGGDRYDTAATIAKTGGPGAVGQDGGRKTAVLSSGVNYPDALAAGGIVFAQHFPQLLTTPTALPGSTASALGDLGVQHVLIIGGTGAIATGVEGQLHGLGFTTERIAGGDRYATALALADLSVDRYGFAPAHLDVATGQAFPDALTAGAHVGSTRSPLLLTPPTTLAPQVCGFVQRRGVTDGHVVGGTGAVDAGAKYSLQECIRPNG